MTTQTPDPATILTQLAVIQRLANDPVTGLPIYAYDNPPYAALTSTTMPLFINYVDKMTDAKEMSSDNLGIDYDETWQYKMNLYLAQYGQGVEGEKYGLLTPYFGIIQDLFGAYPHLKALYGVRKAKIIQITGGTISFADDPYFGIQFVLQVVARTRRLFAKGE